MMSIRILDQAALTCDRTARSFLISDAPSVHAWVMAIILSTELCLARRDAKVSICGLYLMKVLRLKGRSVTFVFKTWSWVAAAHTFNEALALLSDYHKGPLPIVHRGTPCTFPLMQSDKLSSCLLFFVPLSFLIPFLTSLVSRLYSFSLSNLTPFSPFQTHHFPVPSLPAPTRSFFSLFQTGVTLPNLSAFARFPVIKRSAITATILQEIGGASSYLV